MNQHTIADAVVTAMRVHERKPADFYPTPRDVTVALCQWLDLKPETYVWEPACGDGAMAEVLAEFVGNDCVAATDLREDSGYGRGGVDFLSTTADEHFHLADWIITNPPFAVAAEFIAHALTITPNVAMLLKSNYWNAKGRISLFENNPPSDILMLTWRPAFLEAERGRSPLMDVMWCVWREGSDGVTRFAPLERPRTTRNKTQRVVDRYLQLLGL